MDVVLYDHECGLCRSLAALMQRRCVQLAFHSWQDYRGRLSGKVPAAGEEACAALQVWDGERLHLGPEAWQRLLAQHPDLAGLSWLAAKLGLTAQVARSLDALGTTARWLCRSCPPQVRRRRRQERQQQ